jgi:signal transduction histidine kinase
VPDTSAAISLLKQMAGDAYNTARTQAIHGATVVTEDRQGQKIVLDVHILPLHDNLGTPIGMLVTFTDVTSMHRLEKEKRRLDRLASLGEMAANVAHEVRNPLASIKTSMQMLMDDLASSDAEPEATEQSTWAQTSIEVVLKEVERLDAIVRDLLLFARPRQLHRIKCDLVEICNRVLDLLQAQCTAANVSVHRVFADLPTIWVDIGQLEQILFNLFTNALQAMPDGGILTVTCQRIAADHVCQNSQEVGVIQTWNPYSCNGKGEPQSQKGVGGSLVQWVEIAISDTGMGIPPEQIGRIFQPFFTTKAHGIGLGLAITRRLIEDHGGYIRVEGNFGYGATIIVRLPVIEGDDDVNGGE